MKRRHDPPTLGTDALRKAEEIHAETASRWDEVREVAEKLKQANQINHFAEKIAESWRRRA